MNPDRSDNPQPVAGSSQRGKWLLLILVVAVAALAYWRFGDSLTLQNLAQNEAELRAYQAAHPWLVYGIAFGVYVFVAGLALPGAVVLTLLYAWYFGFVPALVLVSCASTTGAVVAFLLSRFLFRDFVEQRFGDRLKNFNRALEREGAFYLFSLRLIPAVPFFVINAVMGLTPIRLRTFWWVSQLGMFPGTAIFVYAGSSVPSLQTLADKGISAVFTPIQMTQIVIALSVLGLFPLTVRWIVKLLPRRSRGTAKDSANELPARDEALESLQSRTPSSR